MPNLVVLGQTVYA